MVFILREGDEVLCRSTDTTTATIYVLLAHLAVTFALSTAVFGDNRVDSEGDLHNLLLILLDEETLHGSKSLYQTETH